MKRRGTLRRRLVIAIVFATVLPLGLLGWRSYLTTRTLVEQTELASIEDATRRTAEGLDGVVTTYIDGLRVQALNPVYRRAVTNLADRGAAHDVAQSFARIDPIHIESIALLAADGSTIVTSGSATNSAEEGGWIPAAFAAKNPIVTTAGNERGYPTAVVIATQIRDALGRPVAVLRARIRVSSFAQVLAKASGATKRNGIIRLRDSSGIIIATWPYPSGKGVPPTKLAWDVKPTRFAIDAETLKTNGIRVRTLRHLTASMARLEETALRLAVAPWYVAISVDESVIMTPAATQARELAVWAFALASVIAVCAALVGSHHSRRIEVLTSVAREFADGKLESRAPETGNDEIGALGSGFNAMADRVGTLVRSLEARTRQLEADIEHRERLEAQLVQSRKLEAVGQLAGGVAHDFNNLLTVILGTTQLVADALGPEHELIEELESVESAARRGAELTLQLLTFARRQRVEPRFVDIHTVVRDCEKLIKRLIGSRHEVTMAFTSAPLVVRIDPSQFTQVLLNLATNARDAMLDKGGEFRIATSVTDAPPSDTVDGMVLPAGPCVCITVSDTGLGMSAETLRRVFEPFFTTKPAGKGTGLGLASVFGIIGQADGAIAVSSTPDQGTTFRIYLPLVTDRPEYLRTPALGMEAIVPTTVRVLALDDDPLVLRAIVSPLQHRGLTCDTASSVDAGLEALSRNHYDLIVSDIMMPGLTGLELVPLVRERHPSLPILLISGYAPEWSAMNDPYTAFLAKPFTSRELIAAMSQLLNAT